MYGENVQRQKRTVVAGERRCFGFGDFFIPASPLWLNEWLHGWPSIAGSNDATAMAKASDEVPFSL